MWKRQKVVVLRELQRAIIYTTKMSKQVMKSHVRDAVHMYLMNWGAMLTSGPIEKMKNMFDVRFLLYQRCHGRMDGSLLRSRSKI
jgi:hypothetical protein